MTNLFKSGLIAALSLVAFSAFADTDPATTLKDIEAMRTKAYADARAAHKTPDFAAIDSGSKAKAEEALKSIDFDKIEPKDAWNWAKICDYAGEHAKVCALTHKFLTTNPPAEDTFQVQMLMMTNCNALGEADMLESTLVTVKPQSIGESNELASEAAYEFADTIAKKRGYGESLKVLEQVSKNVLTTDAATEAQKNLATEKTSLQKRNQPVPSDADLLKTLTTRYKNEADAVRLTFVEKEAELLQTHNRTPRALETIDSYIRTLPADSTAIRGAKMLRIRTALPGTTPPALTIEKEYGSFVGYDALKGHVVVIDTFAHWCGPCKASFPDMRKMYDDLHEKGLDIVGVTAYYGFYGTDRNLAPQAEYDKMADFRTQYNMDWPTVFGPKTNFENLGITGIPTTYLIDKSGKVRSVHVGYSHDEFLKLRKEIEGLLAE